MLRHSLDGHAGIERQPIHAELAVRNYVARRRAAVPSREPKEVGTFATGQPVCALIPSDGVIASAAQDGVVSEVAAENIVAAKAGDVVVASECRDGVSSGGPGQGIVAVRRASRGRR